MIDVLALEHYCIEHFQTCYFMVGNHFLIVLMGQLQGWLELCLVVEFVVGYMDQNFEYALVTFTNFEIEKN